MRPLVVAFALGALAVEVGAQTTRWSTQLTDLYPSLSPDGSRLVFQSNRLGRTTLFLSDTNGANVVALSGTGARITPVWSPDGRRIAFAEFVGGQLEIMTMNADGSDARRLTDYAGADMHPHWSADGSRIFFNSDRSTPPGARRGSVHDVFSMRADGSDVRQHTDCRAVCTYPVPSPDGRQVIYRREFARAGFDWDLSPSNEDSEVVIADIDGRNERNLSANAAFDGWPEWSPDGKWVAFASNRAGPAFTGQIYLIRPDGTGLRQLTSGEWSHAQPSFSRDGRRVFVYRLREGTDYQYGFIASIAMPADRAPL